uniref:Uncharacterized protein n=1 Tax=Anopheles culicifacies TaxID=139723 RepID=A0A182LWG8_9DIPT
MTVSLNRTGRQFHRTVGCVWLWSVGVLLAGSQLVVVNTGASVAVTTHSNVIITTGGRPVSVWPETGPGDTSNASMLPDNGNGSFRQQLREDALPDGLDTGTVPVIELKRGQCRCWNSTEEALGEVQCRCLGKSIVRVPQKLTGMQRLTLEKVGIKQLRTNALTVYADTLQDLFFIYLREFHRIEPAAFSRLRHLRTLYIAHAPKLEFLPADVFEGISTKLKTL